MKAFTCILICFTVTICKAQTKQEYGNSVYSILRIDSSSKKELRFIHFEHSTGVVFPIKYAQRKFGDVNTFFIPDTALLKKIDKEIINQFCQAEMDLNEQSMKDALESTDKKEIRKARRAISAEKIHIKKWFDKWKANLAYYDKQYVGFLFMGGTKVVYINLLDFRKDPYHLKEVFDVSWIEGFDGWFNSNRITFWYYADKNKLTCNPLK